MLQQNYCARFNFIDSSVPRNVVLFNQDTMHGPSYGE